jgi:hypothetical protein
MSPSDRVAQLYPLAQGSLFITYDLQGYSGGTLTCLHTGQRNASVRKYSWYEHHFLLGCEAEIDCYYPEDGNSRFIQNVGNDVPDYMEPYSDVKEFLIFT